MVLGLVRGGVLPGIATRGVFPGVVGGGVVPGTAGLLPLVLRTVEGGRMLPRVDGGVLLRVGASELDGGEGVVSSLDSNVVDNVGGIVDWLVAVVSGVVVSGRDVGGEGVVVGSVDVVVWQFQLSQPTI